MRWGGGLNRHVLSHGSFEQIISLENLFSAWHEFKVCKRKKLDVAEFEFSLEFGNPQRRN